MTGEAGKSEESSINQESQQHSHTFDNCVVDHMKGYFSSDLHPMLGCQPEKEEEDVVQGHFPSPETNIDIQQCFQQNEVFQSCLSSLENDVVVQFLNGLDTDEGFENASMGTLDCEIVRDINSSHSQEYYEQEFISIHSFESQNDSPQANFQKFNKTKSDAHNMAVTFEDIQECMNIFVDMHGRVDKPIAAISFENVLKTEETEQEQQTLAKEAFLSVFSHQEEMICHGFQDPVAILLQSSVKEEFVSFISSRFGFNFCFQPPLFTFVYLLKKDVIGEKSGSQLLDWLHWHFSIT
jgi:hypothetical protein